MIKISIGCLLNMIGVCQINQRFPARGGSYGEKAWRCYHDWPRTILQAMSINRPGSVVIDAHWSFVGDDILALLALGRWVKGKTSGRSGHGCRLEAPLA